MTTAQNTPAAADAASAAHGLTIAGLAAPRPLLELTDHDARNAHGSVMDDLAKNLSELQRRIFWSEMGAGLSDAQRADSHLAKETLRHARVCVLVLQARNAENGRELLAVARVAAPGV